MDENRTPEVTLRFRAISPDGKKPEGWQQWPTWSNVTLEHAMALRDAYWPGWPLMVERTSVEPWEPAGSAALAERVEAALAVYAEHKDFLTRRGEYPQRANDCVCLACRVVRALTGTPEPEDGLITDRIRD